MGHDTKGWGLGMMLRGMMLRDGTLMTILHISVKLRKGESGSEPNFINGTQARGGV